jgi:hypothetical protein
MGVGYASAMAMVILHSLRGGWRLEGWEKGVGTCMCNKNNISGAGACKCKVGGSVGSTWHLEG